MCVCNKLEQNYSTATKTVLEKSTIGPFNMDPFDSKQLELLCRIKHVNMADSQTVSTCRFSVQTAYVQQHWLSHQRANDVTGLWLKMWLID